MIIPKLQCGFVISSLELSDVFGTLVHLKYFTNKTRRKIMDYRCGLKKPDESIKKLIKFYIERCSFYGRVDRWNFTLLPKYSKNSKIVFGG